MTTTEPTPIAAAITEPAPHDFVNWRSPEVTEVEPLIGLTGWRPNSSLDLCDPTNQPFNNCTLPKVWVDQCDPMYDEALHREDRSGCHKWQPALFRPFQIFDVAEAPCVDPVLDPQDVANDTLAESTVWAITSALDRGLGSTTTTLRNANPDAAADLTPGVTDAATPGQAVHPEVAISTLLQAMAKRGLGRMSIHVPVWALPALRDYTQNVGGILRADLNAPVIAGLGYSGVGPDSTGNIDLTDSGQVYFYVMRGVPEYRIGDIESYATEGTLTHERTNRQIAEGHRRGMVAFDAGCVFAIRVCLNKAATCD